MSWRLKIILDDGTEELDDEFFDSEEEAEAKFEEWLACWSAGRETLKLAGREYIEADIEDCEIWEE